MRRIARVLAAFAALILILPGGAQARPGPPLQPFPHHATNQLDPVLSDGARYFVLNSQPGNVRVYDTERRTTRDVPIGEKCVVRDATPGVALVACPTPFSSYGSETPYLLRLSDRTVRPIPGHTPEGPTERWREIGRHWILGAASSAKNTTAYVNWRTGERRSDPDDPAAEGFHDIDDRKLRVYPRNVFDRDGSRALGYAGGSLMLFRPGRDVRLTSGRAWPVELSAGLVSWTASARTVRAYDERHGVRLSWRLDDDDVAEVRAFHTRRHLLVSARSEGSDVPRLLWARIRK